MLTALVIAGLAALILAGVSLSLYTQWKAALQSKTEYKELFEASEEAYKKVQEEGSSYLVQLDRGRQLLEEATTQLNARNEEITSLQATLTFEQEQYANLLGQKKSSEVRTGKITEQIAPFLEDYPLDPSTARFIGDPIDFCHFLDDKVVFVEVKSGKSQLSTKQRRIRDLIREGKVEFRIYRVEGK